MWNSSRTLLTYPVWRHATACGCAALLAIGLCSSCSSSRRTAANDPFQAAPVKTAESERAAGSNAIAHRPSETATVHNEVKVFEAPFPNPIQQTAHAQLPPDVKQAAKFTPAEPRTDIAQAAYEQGPRGAAPHPHKQTLADMYPDEYLLDGGDRGLPVHYGERSMQGLETEDTVAEFTDHTGEEHVEPSNRVSIYSPRFGAMRTVSSPQADTGIERAAATADEIATAGLSNQVLPVDHSQRDALEAMDTRSRASGLDSENELTTLQHAAAPSEHVKMVNAIQNLAFVQSGMVLESETAALAYGISAAGVWTRAENPVILAIDHAAQEVKASFRAQEIVGLEDQHLTRGKLRIVKLADRKTAQPGDVITFTIRYDNLGDRELRDIRILDNLTPRLEYIDQSATSERAGRLVVEENAAGSLVLIFELDEPLPGHTGGVATFQARVR